MGYKNETNPTTPHQHWTIHKVLTLELTSYPLFNYIHRKVYHYKKNSLKTNIYKVKNASLSHQTSPGCPQV